MSETKLGDLDAFGKACLAYLKGARDENIEVFSSISEKDIIPVNYLFRTYNQMPKLEQIALKKVKGNVLDVGAGAGCHSLWLKSNGYQVTSLDFSQGAAQSMIEQGLENVIQSNFFELELTEKFDTLLLLMNGIGISGTLDQLPKFLEKCFSFLNPTGQVLLETADLNYLLDEGESDIDEYGDYLGEVEYKMTYKNAETDWFDWLYIDTKRLKSICDQMGLNMEIVYQGENSNYLIRITKT